MSRSRAVNHHDGSSEVVNFTYEKLFIFYFACGKLGHIERLCD